MGDDERVANDTLVVTTGVLCDEDLYQDQVPMLSIHADISTPLALSSREGPLPGTTLEIVEECGHRSTRKRHAATSAALLSRPAV